MSKNIVYQKEHLLVEFNSLLKDLSQKFEHNTITNIDFQKDCFEKIVDLISPYVMSKKMEDCLKIIEQLLEVIPGYRRGYKTRRDVLCKNLYFRAAIGDYEQTVFWHLSQKFISIWYDLTYRERLNYKQSQILLVSSHTCNDV